MKYCDAFGAREAQVWQNITFAFPWQRALVLNFHPIAKSNLNSEIQNITGSVNCLARCLMNSYQLEFSLKSSWFVDVTTFIWMTKPICCRVIVTFVLQPIVPKLLMEGEAGHSSWVSSVPCCHTSELLSQEGRHKSGTFLFRLADQWKKNLF